MRYTQPPTYTFFLSNTSSLTKKTITKTQTHTNLSFLHKSFLIKPDLESKLVGASSSFDSRITYTPSTFILPIISRIINTPRITEKMKHKSNSPFLSCLNRLQGLNNGVSGKVYFGMCFVYFFIWKWKRDDTIVYCWVFDSFF